MEKDDIFEKLLNDEHEPKVNYCQNLKITMENLRETNRDKLLNKSLYDLLSEINDGYDGYLCIIENLEAKYRYDKEKFRCRGSATKEDCSKCIQRYLNKEEK